MNINSFREMIKYDKKDYTIFANSSAYIFEEFDNLNWAGFYKVEGQKLYLHAFQGKVACTEIPFERGVCGLAAREQKNIVVDNVHDFADHIACDSASLSEMVLPIFKNGQLYAVLDIDSPIEKRFDEKTQQDLNEIAKVISEVISNL